ncbi:MAG: META domain-containing protein [Treponema sp.]|jgi:hypothetical protein|nr:META domain-containing protein [Treponema sp.]
MKMDKQFIVIQAIISVLFFGISGCAGKGAAVKSDISSSHTAQVDWNRVKENTWKLVSINKGKLTSTVDRKEYETYTLRFSDDSTLAKRVYGRGAPNTYSAMFNIGEYPAISIGTIVSTKMAAIFESDGLKENEYFTYLGKVSRWSMDNYENLKLVSTDEEGEEVSLIFKKI